MNLEPIEKRLMRRLLIDPESVFDGDAYTSLSGMESGTRTLVNLLASEELIETKGMDAYRLTRRGRKALKHGKYSPRRKVWRGKD